MLFRRKRTRQWSVLLLCFMVILSSFIPFLTYEAKAEALQHSLVIEDAEELARIEQERENSITQQEFKQEGTEYHAERNASEQESEYLDGSSLHVKQGLELLEEWMEAAWDEKLFAADGKIELDVLEALEQDKFVSVIIRLQEDVKAYEQLWLQAQSLETQAEKGRYVVQSLQRTAQQSQQGLLKELTNWEQEQSVLDIQSFWIFNGVGATVNQEVLGALVKRSDISRITLDRVIQLPEVEIEAQPPRLPEWGLEKIQAPRVWGEYGIRGQGVVVGIMDTGVHGDHEALRHNYRGRDGEHQYSWIDFSGHGYQTPHDGNGHGTHVAGTAVGGGAGQPIGVAPEAEWIAAKIFTDGGSATTSGIHQAFQWFLAPGGDPAKAPQVVNNSWGSSDMYRTEFLEGVRAWVAAGIFPLFAAGNDGPGSQTIGSPGSFPESFAIGSTDRYDRISAFSSRGPVYWLDEQGQQKRYLKPEVSAPGQQIYSAWPNGGYHTISGTSMATPHVAGAIALLYQAAPDLSINEIKDLLQQTARAEAHMGQLPNDFYGYGIIDVYQAITEQTFAGEIYGQLRDEYGNPVSGQILIQQENVKIQVAENGQFAFKLREGTHTATITAFGYETKIVELVVHKGATTQVEWKLKEMERYTLNGVVQIEETGAPVSFATVRLQSVPVLPVRTNQAGEFTLQALPQGTYTLNVTGASIVGQELVVHLEQDMEVEIKVSGKQGRSIPEWRTANQNPQRQAVAPTELAVDSLEEEWRYQVQGQILFSTPAVAEGVLVLTLDSGRVIGVDSVTGTEKWSFRTGQLNRSSPTIEAGVVYVAGGSDRNIYALDAQTGRLLWARQLDAPAIYEAPVYHAGNLYLASAWTTGSQVTALDAGTGELKWKQSVGDGTVFGATLGEGMLFVGSYDARQLQALDMEDGKILWTKALTSSEGFASQSVYVDGILYVNSSALSGDRGTLWALDAQTGEELWSVAGIGDTQAGNPVVFEHLVIVGSSTRPGLYAYDRITGEKVWENQGIGTMLNNGTATANGVLLVIDSLNALQVLDVYSGDLLTQFPLSHQSTSGVVVTDGRAYATDLRGVTSFFAPGVLAGALKNQEGEPVQGTIRLLGEGYKVQTNEQGEFELFYKPGDYDVRFEAYGYQQITQTFSLLSGYRHEQHLSLEIADKGSIEIQVKDGRTSLPLSGVEIEVLDTPINGTTDSEGYWSNPDIYEGQYVLQLHVGGYETAALEITIQAQEENVFHVDLQPFDVAVLNDYQGQLTTALKQHGFAAEERGWDVIQELERYRIIYLNGAYGSGGWKPNQEEFKQLLDRAAEQQVSVIFADTWGVSYGTVSHLRDFYNDPAYVGTDYMSSNVYLRVDEEHPIVAGLPVGASILVDTSGEFAWFNQYSGRHLATVGSDRLGLVGTGIAYKAMSEGHAHVLLSDHAVSPWSSPIDHWQPAQHQLLQNTISYLLHETQYGAFQGKVTAASGEPLEAIIEVVETGVTVHSDVQTGEFELYHDEGQFEILIRKSGYATQYVDLEFIHGQPVVQQFVLESSENGTITGTVSDKWTGQPISDVQIEVYDLQGEFIEATRSIEGYFEITNLLEDTYVLKLTKEGYVFLEYMLEVTGAPYQLALELIPAPRVGVIGDYGSAGANLRAMLAQVGITAVNYTTVASLMPDLAQYDVIFFNEQSPATLTQEGFMAFLEEADRLEVSIVYGDTYYTAAGINHLVRHTGNPKERGTQASTLSAAGYIVLAESPLFEGAQAGEFKELLLPAKSSIGYVQGYEGYPLATIKHEHMTQEYGLGAGFKPRTSASMELFLTGHGFSIAHTGADYTAEGKQILLDALIWAAYAEFSQLTGTVVNHEGQPLKANIQVQELGIRTVSDETEGSFTIPLTDGHYEIEISAYGYEAERASIHLNEDLEPIQVQLTPQASNGEIVGKLIDHLSGDGLEGVEVKLVEADQMTTTDRAGQFSFRHVEPGSYTIKGIKEGYLNIELEVFVHPNQKTELQESMRVSPIIGLIGDTTISSQVPLRVYLEEHGFTVEDLFYTDLDRLAYVDLVFANSAYGTAHPTKEQFLRFTQELDRLERSIIWTGQHGGQGSIGFLREHTGNPAVVHSGNLAGTLQAHVELESHPIVAGVESSFQLINSSNYYYGFDDYAGEEIISLEHPSTTVGSMVAFKGRTLNSVEILLGNMTIANGFHPGDPLRFDQNRQRILLNSILWALDHEESYIAEWRGRLMNQFDLPVQGQLTVIETGQTLQTELDGSFYLALDSGSYTILLEAFGHQSQDIHIQVERGHVLEETYLLTAVHAGYVSGQVNALQTSTGIAGATIQVVGTPIATLTDQYGYYELLVPEGSYPLRVMAEGYTPRTVQLAVREGEEMELNLSLTESEKIAIVATAANGARIQSFIEQYGYEADLWLNSSVQDLMERLAEYKLVILNDRHSTAMPEAVFTSFLQLADEHGVSIIFTSQYNSGTIADLARFYQDPVQVNQGFVPREIYYEVQVEHPIFAGFHVGDRIKLLENTVGTSPNQQYSVFEQYSGVTLATQMHPDRDRLGDGLAYQFKSAEHVHLLLGSLHAGSYGHPESRWTEDAKQIYLNAIDWALQASQSEVSGVVLNEDNEPVGDAKVSIVGQQVQVQTDRQGNYSLGLGIGEYEVSVEARGYHSQSAMIEIEQVGERLEQNFVLQKMETARLYGHVYDVQKQPLADVALRLIELSQQSEEEHRTDELGKYEFVDVIAGEYQLVVEAHGYQTVERFVTLEEGMSLEVNFSLSDYDIAVLGDHQEVLTGFLIEHSLPAQSRDWSILNDVYNYKLIIVNTPKGTLEQITELIELSDLYQTSLVFVDTWGKGTGSIEQLGEVLGSPQFQAHGYNEGSVQVQLEAEWEWLNKHHLAWLIDLADDAGMISMHPEQSYYSTFKEYEGFVVGSAIVDQQFKGSTIAFDYRSKDHVHLLLSTYTANNMMGPNQGWTNEGRELYRQLVQWARDIEQPLPGEPAWDEERVVTRNGEVSVSGTAGYRTVVDIYVNGVWQQELIPDRAGRFTFASTFERGEHVVRAIAKNFAGEAVNTTDLIVTFEQAKPQILTPTDGSYVNSGTVVVEGRTFEQGQVDIYREGFKVGSEYSSDGTFLFNIQLEEGENQVWVVLTSQQGISIQSEKISIYQDTISPEIMIIDPADGTLVNESIIYIKGRINEKNLAELRVNGLEEYFKSDGSFEVKVELQEGWNTISFEAYDFAGNVTYKSIQLVYRAAGQDKEKPDKEIKDKRDAEISTIGGVVDPIHPPDPQENH